MQIFHWKNSIQRLYFVQNLQHLLLYSTSSSSSTNAVNSSFANYLVNSLGFSHQQAVLTCSKLPIKKVNEFKFCDNAISVVNFLKNHGFDDTHVRKIVSLYPLMLCSKVDKTLKPKFEYLQDEGFFGSDLVRVISANPRYLLRHMNHVISNLRDVLGSVENVGKLLAKSNSFTTLCSLENMICNIALLKNDYGIDIEAIRSNILLQHAPYLRNPEVFRNAVARIEEELRIPRYSKMFFYGIVLLCGSSKKSIESKCRVLKSFGWTECQVFNLMQRNPCIFSFSAENMRKKLGFLMNELGYDPGFLVSHSALFTYSLEKRMLPRYRVLLVLKEKGLLDYNFYTATMKTETEFFRIVVEPFKDVAPGFLEFYQKSKGCPNVEPLPTLMPSLVPAN